MTTEEKDQANSYDKKCDGGNGTRVNYKNVKHSAVLIDLPYLSRTQ